MAGGIYHHSLRRLRGRTDTAVIWPPSPTPLDVFAASGGMEHVEMAPAPSFASLPVTAAARARQRYLGETGSLARRSRVRGVFTMAPAGKLHELMDGEVRARGTEGQVEFLHISQLLSKRTGR